MNGPVMMQLTRLAQADAVRAAVSQAGLHSGFLRQAHRDPQQLAVLDGDRQLSYEQIERWSAWTAERIAACGVPRNQLVAVLCHKGWAQLAAVLGVLRAGAAYLPIDPQLPPEQRAYLLADGAVGVAVTTLELDAQVRWPRGVERVCVDDRAQHCPAAAWEAGRCAELRPDDLACVIYVSDGTGVPKGVQVTHRGALNTIADINVRFGVDAHDRVLALSALGLDLSIYDVFGLWTAGGTVVLPGRVRSASRWLDLMQARNVTVWNSVPALMHMLLQLAAQRAVSLPALRLVLLSGEQISAQLADRIRRLAPAVKLVGLTGSPETSIWSACYSIDDDARQWANVPHGRPLQNQQLHVLNARLQPCPAWVTGELYVGGIGVAPGYWRDELRTRQKFVLDTVAGVQLYRTGDRARRLPDDSIAFLGSGTAQLVRNGQSVDLIKIETALLANRRVLEAVVVPAEEADGNVQLCAFVAGDEQLRAAQLRDCLKEMLAEHMLPQTIEVLARLPRDTDDKIDRVALRARAKEAVVAAAPAHPGATLAEGDTLQPQVELLRRVVTSVTRIHVPDARANLIELGATSIDIIRIINLLEQETGVRLSYEELYGAADVVEAARLLGKPAAATAAPTSVSMRRPVAEVIYDPLERERFKKEERAIRRDLGGLQCLRLNGMLPDSLAQTLYRRRSHRHFRVHALPWDSFSGLLSALRRSPRDSEPRSLYPSAGALYAVQVYLFAKPNRIEGLSAGTYYYNPLDHSLLFIDQQSPITRGAFDWINKPLFDQAAFGLLFVADYRAIEPLYGNVARDFCLLEAGAMAQLLMTCAAEQGVGLCGIGGLDFEPAKPAFALTDSHELLHSMLGGMLEATDASATEVAEQRDMQKVDQLLRTLGPPAAGRVEQERDE